MKFFEFNNYEYYGLIIAVDKEKAKLGYEKEVAEIDTEERKLEPDEITLEDALKIYQQSTIEDCQTIDDKIEDFYKNVSYFQEYISRGSEPYLVLLVDDSLIL